MLFERRGEKQKAFAVIRTASGTGFKSRVKKLSKNETVARRLIETTGRSREIKTTVCAAAMAYTYVFKTISQHGGPGPKLELVVFPASRCNKIIVFSCQHARNPFDPTATYTVWLCA